MPAGATLAAQCAELLLPQMQPCVSFHLGRTSACTIPIASCRSARVLLAPAPLPRYVDQPPHCPAH
eukprot:14926325-Alexandrium_andersonii.AAC.1